MNIEEELLNFLHESIRNNDTKYRDIQLILFFFGFRGELWPTLEDAAVKFDVGESENRRSERPRQIIKNKFTSKVSLSDLPKIASVSRIFQATEFSTVEELALKLKKEQLVPELFSIKGVLNLLQHLGVCKEYDIYTNKLIKASRTSINSESNLYLLRKSEITNIRNALKKLIVYPGIVGISNLDSFFIKNEIYLPYKTILVDVLRSRDDVWFSNIDNECFFMVEDRDNTLINRLEKIKNISDAVNIKKLAIVLANSFKQRTPPKGNNYPSINVIEQYIKNSRFTECNGNVVKINVEATILRDIETDVVNFMSNKGIIDFVEIKEHLEAKGYTKPSIDKAILNSSLVYADKSVRKSYKYSLLITENYESNESLDRYALFKSKLLSACSDGTDDDIQSSKRKEQQILRQWLFEGKKNECCAICQNNFEIESLVTAHKKVRSDCSFNERIDPYVVMPLCKFGCDHLYESGVLKVSGGIVLSTINHKECTTYEKVFIENSVGNKLMPEWLKGNTDYFR